MHTTQLDFARAGIITDKMKQAAQAEGVTPEFIRDGIAVGTIIICHNLKHANGRPLAVGKGLRTKVNANIGSSADDLDISKEQGEVVIAFAYSRKIPLFGNVSLCLDFEGGTRPTKERDL